MARYTEIEVITLFVVDVEAARDFYVGVLGASEVFAGDTSVIVDMGTLMLNLLVRDQAPTLIEPAPIAEAAAGPAALLTIRVEDVDAAYAELTERGARFLNGPLDRPWGRRTAAFVDPDGTAWEIAEVLPEQ